MSNLRFAMLAVGLFALAFVLISWGNKGFPVMAYGPASLTPDARIPTFAEATKKGLRKEWNDSKTAQSDGNKERDALRLELLQASNAYKLSPCDDTMKKNLVTALSNYINAWHDMAYCSAGYDGCPRSFSDRLDVAAAAFKTPADINVHNALREAINEGGISREDFAYKIRDDVFMWTGPPFRSPKLACFAARQAGNQQ